MLEPWLRGTLEEIGAIRRQVMHALELAVEDLDRWCGDLSDAEMAARPFGVAPVAFHLRHIGRSLDRLLTYAEGRALSSKQLDDLGTEQDSELASTQVMEEVQTALQAAMMRVRAFDEASFEQVRSVGRGLLPSTAGGLLVHCAEHTQRHVGQAITTSQIVRRSAKSEVPSSLLSRNSAQAE